MPKNPIPITFDFKEVVTALVKNANIHEGMWMLYIEFGLTAVNIPIYDEKEQIIPTEENQLKHIKPTAMLPIKKIGLVPADRMSNIAVDASVVNPKTKSTPARKTPKKN